MDRIKFEKYTIAFWFNFPRHPLLRYFQTPDKQNIVKILEIAVYLKKLSCCKNLNLVIDVMKNSFFTGYMQLAYAYRFQRAGGTNIELEPKTDFGKTDIYFEFDGLPFLAECYVPKTRKENNSVFKLNNGISNISKACENSGKKFRISIKLIRSVSKNSEGEALCNSIVKSINEIHDKKIIEGETYLAKYFLEKVDRFGQEDEFPKKAKKGRLFGYADAGIKFYKTYHKDLEKLQLGQDIQINDYGRLYIWQPDNEKKELTDDQIVNEFKNKLSKKIKQTKRKGDNPRRVVITTFRFANENDKRTISIAKKIQNALIPKFSNIAAILLTRNVWLENNRFQFRFTVLIGKEENAFLNLFYKNFVVMKKKKIFYGSINKYDS